MLVTSPLFPTRPYTISIFQLFILQFPFKPNHPLNNFITSFPSPWSNHHPSSLLSYHQTLILHIPNLSTRFNHTPLKISITFLDQLHFLTYSHNLNLIHPTYPANNHLWPPFHPNSKISLTPTWSIPIQFFQSPSSLTLIQHSKIFHFPFSPQIPIRTPPS